MESYGIFIDGDNINPKYYSYIDELIRDRGKIIMKKVYGDFSEENIKIWKKTCLEYGIEPIQAWREKHKNSSDMKMIIDITAILYQNDKIDAYVIVSGDIDFKEICKTIIEKNKTVIGISCFEKSTSKTLKNFCSEFIILDHENQPLFKEDILTQILNILNINNQCSLSYLKIKLLNKDPLFNEFNYGYKRFKDFVKSFNILEIDNNNMVLKKSL